jgi:ribose transport system substrate-binding protein
LRNVVTDRQALLERLPDVIDKNLQTGDMANEN